MKDLFKQAWREAAMELRKEMWPYPKFGIGKAPAPSKFEQYLRNEYLKYKRIKYEVLSSKL